MYCKLLGRLRTLGLEKPKVILLVTYYREHYFFCFANFLLGRDIYGPGKYIFGVFDNREIDHTYMVKYNEYDSE